jgi:replication factor A1
MHYELVSDLLTKDEFDERVENKCKEFGGSVDDTCAAMLVVEELGRSHIKIGEIRDVVTTLVSFFGKILEITPIREFKHEKNGEDIKTGLVASLILSDPTGTIKVTLWDAMTTVISELEIGSVLEVIAKPRRGYRNEVTCVALRPSQVTILKTKKPSKFETVRIPLAVKVLYVGDAHEITRRDGSVVEFQEILVGDPSGTARIITWDPELFANLEKGESVNISGLTRKEDGDSVEYVADNRVVITPHPEPIKVLTRDASDVVKGQTSVVIGVVRYVSPVRTFTTRQGTELRVRSIKLESDTGHGYVNVTCWNKTTEVTVFTGDKIEIINAPAKLNKYGDVELCVGRGAILREREEKGTYIEIEGFIIPRAEGITIDDGTNAFLIITNLPLVPATYVRATGICKNFRLYAENVEAMHISAADLKDRLLRL